MAQINVHTSLPRTVALGSDLKLDLCPSNWRWVHCLTLPLNTFNALQFSQRPYKWIRYAIGVVIGAAGVLSTSTDSSDVVDYNTLPTALESADLYYHTNDEERRRMFPVDPDILRTHITSSVDTSRRGQFREEVARRDGRQCVLTEAEESYCDAAHLLAYSKGDVYISTHTQRRSRSLAQDDIIQEIDSVRNGLFLNLIAHGELGKKLAFLITPNFAMDTADIDPTAPPTEKRCTAHLFVTPRTPFLNVNLNPDYSRQIPDTPDFPPVILFDSVYASAVLRHFGAPDLKESVTGAWKDSFYPEGVTSAGQAEYKSLVDERATKRKRTEKQADEREERYKRRHEEAPHVPDTFDMLMWLPYAFVPPNELQAALRSAKEKVEAAEQRRVQEKVESWIRQVDTA